VFHLLCQTILFQLKKEKKTMLTKVPKRKKTLQVEVFDFSMLFLPWYDCRIFHDHCQFHSPGGSSITLIPSRLVPQPPILLSWRGVPPRFLTREARGGTT